MSTTLHVDRHAFHDVALPDRRVLLHVPSTGLFNLDATTAELIDHLREQARVTEAELHQALSVRHRSDDIRQAIDDLRSLGILRADPAQPDVGARVKVEAFPLSSLVLNVNTGCNLSCTYCYKEDLTTPAKGQKLALETAERSIELLLQQGAQRERLSLVFFGGEPLSNLPLIKAATAYAERRCAEVGKQLDLSLTTNATLLNEDIVDWLDAHRFGVSVSMDGPQAVHDRRRKTKIGRAHV